jgi:hypothetical protein
MAMLDGLHQAILVRSLWARVSDPHLSADKARQLAVKEIAAEHRVQGRHQRRLDAASRPVTPRQPVPHDDAGRQLISKVAGLLSRLAVRPHPSRRRLREPAPTPAPISETTARPGIVERLANAFTEPTPPPPPRSPLVVAEGSRAQLIDDLPHNYQGDHILANWRASIESNVVNFETRRGGPKRSWYVG